MPQQDNDKDSAIQEVAMMILSLNPKSSCTLKTSAPQPPNFYFEENTVQNFPQREYCLNCRGSTAQLHTDYATGVQFKAIPIATSFFSAINEFTEGKPFPSKQARLPVKKEPKISDTGADASAAFGMESYSSNAGNQVICFESSEKDLYQQLEEVMKTYNNMKSNLTHNHESELKPPSTEQLYESNQIHRAVLHHSWPGSSQDNLANQAATEHDAWKRCAPQTSFTHSDHQLGEPPWHEQSKNQGFEERELSNNSGNFDTPNYEPETSHFDLDLTTFSTSEGENGIQHTGCPDSTIKFLKHPETVSPFSRMGLNLLQGIPGECNERTTSFSGKKRRKDVISPSSCRQDSKSPNGTYDNDHHSTVKAHKYRKSNRCCEFESCETTRHFGLPGEKSRFCFFHKKEGMINLSLRKCLDCNKTASFGYPDTHRKLFCSVHKKEGTINLSIRRCFYPDCEKTANYGSFNEPLRFCSAHKTDKMKLTRNWKGATSKGEVAKVK